MVGSALAAVSFLSRWAMPALILGIPLYGFARGVPVYRTFVEGAEEGLNVAARILPYLVAIMFATSLFRASGAMDVLVAAFRLLTAVGVPAEVIPLLFLKPISGAASLSYTIDLMNRLGPDSFPAFLACVSQASFDTTFYVVSLYFGSIGVRNTRHTIPVALLGDVTGFIVALLVSRRLFPL